MSNRVIHFEIPIDDSGRASAFYEKALGWTITKWGPINYWLMTTGDEAGPGAEGALTPREEAPEGVLIYMGVDSIDAAMRAVEDAGGELVTGKLAVPGMGWLARFRDPDGNLIGMFEMDSTATMSDDGSGK